MPEPWRKQRGGKFYGSFYVSIGKEDVCLHTQSASIALQLRDEALGGRRNFDTDAQAVAKAMVAGAEGGAAGTEGALPTAPPSPPPAAPPPAPAPPAPPEQPPAPAPPDSSEGDATNAAAAETAASSPAPPAANDNAIKMDPQAMRQLLSVGADAMVELQLGLQAWVIKKRTGKEPGVLPPDAAVRKLASECWSQQFLRWFPDLDNVPPWILGLALVGMAAPYQLANATPIKKEPEKPETAGQPEAQAA